MKKELVKLPEEFQAQVVKVSDLEWSRNVALRYVPFLEEVSELAIQLEGMSKEDPKNWEPARKIKIRMGKIRSAITEIKKEDKQDLTVKTKHIDALFNITETKVTLVQKAAEEIEKYEQKLEEERKKVLSETRLALMQEYLNEGETPLMDLGSLTEDVFEALLEGTRIRFEKAKKELEDAKALAELKAKAIALHEERKDSVIDVWQYLDIEKTDFSVYSEEDFSVAVANAREKKRLADEEILLQKEKQKQLEEKLESLRQEKIKLQNKLNNLYPYGAFTTVPLLDIANLGDAEYEKELTKLKKLADNKAKEEEKSKKLKEELEAKLEAERKKFQEIEEKRLKEENDKKEAAEKVKKMNSADRLTTWVNSVKFTMDKPVIEDQQFSSIQQEIEVKLEGFKKWALTQINNTK
jgi:flagellar biosynthesis chaperone FliJ